MGLLWRQQAELKEGVNAIGVGPGDWKDRLGTENELARDRMRSNEEVC